MATSQKRKVTVTTPRTLNSLVYLPDEYASAAEPWPLIVFLHGAGERGGVQKVRKQGLPRKLENGGNIPFVTVAPACPLNTWWPNHFDLLNALLDDVLAKYKVDPKRVYLTGLSMGGHGTWTWGMVNPERFAAFAPICGYYMGIFGELERVVALKDKPVWAFHGAADSVVNVIQTAQMVNALRAAGGSPKFTVYPELDHDSWTITYDNPELYNWFLQHKLP